MPAPHSREAPSTQPVECHKGSEFTSAFSAQMG